MVNSPDFWLVLEPLTNNAATTADVFALLSDIVTGPRLSLTADNYDAVASLLNAFAMSAGQAARTHRQRDHDAQRNRQPRPNAAPVKEAIERGAQAMTTVVTMTERVPTFISQSHLDPKRAWRTYWSRPLRCLMTHASNPVRSIRAQALGGLQRILLSPTLATLPVEKDGEAGKPDVAWLFTHTLFPLLIHLLKPEVWHTDPAGMGETRLAAAVLTCKVYLRFLDSLFSSTLPIRAKHPADSTDMPAPASPIASETAASPNGVAREKSPAPPADGTPSSPEDASQPKQSPAAVPIFLRTLDLLDRLVKSTASAQQPRSHNGSANAEALEEAIPEGLKNVVLVMSHVGYLRRPEEMEEESAESREWKEGLWMGVEGRLERFVPGLLGEILPPPEIPENKEEEGNAEQEGEGADAGTSEKEEERKAENDSAIDDTGGGTRAIEQEVKG